jgi:hypothetical protein
MVEQIPTLMNRTIGAAHADRVTPRTSARAVDASGTTAAVGGAVWSDGAGASELIGNPLSLLSGCRECRGGLWQAGEEGLRGLKRLLPVRPRWRDRDLQQAAALGVDRIAERRRLLGRYRHTVNE